MNVEIRKTGNDMELEDKELSSCVIDSAIKVHKTLGPGFIEAFYEEALCIELSAALIPYERQKSIMISYQGNVIGEHRLDLLIDRKLVVELKAVAQLDPIHFSILRSYLKATDVSSDLILNFNSMPLLVKRVGREYLPH